MGGRPGHAQIAAGVTHALPLPGIQHVGDADRAPSGPKRALWCRLLRGVLLAGAILIVSYWLLANILLRTRLFRNATSGSSVNFAITGNASDLRFDYASAYSYFPGQAHVEGLTIRGRDRSVEWRLTLDHVDVKISLLNLLHHEFHATRVRASGLSLRARLRLHRRDVTPAVMAALPPIAGFADPPLLGTGPEPPPLTDANYNLWMVDLENVDVDHVREVWIQTVRSEGDSRIRGRWLFRPLRWLDVGPATVDAHQVDLSYGSHPLVTGLAGSFEATVHPLGLRQMKVRTLFDHISYRGELRGRAMLAGALHSFAPRSRVRSPRCEERFDANLVLDHGKLADGTRVLGKSTDCRLEASGLAFEATIVNELGIHRDLATLRTHLSGLRVSRLGVERARVVSIATTLTGRKLHLAQLLGDARFSLDVSGAETSDIGLWRDLFPSISSFVVRSGKVTAGGHAEGSVAKRHARARLHFSARHFRVEHGADRLTADITSVVPRLEVSLSGGWVAGAATVSATDIAVRRGRAALAGKLEAHVEMRRGTWASRTFDLSGSNVVLRNVSVGAARSGAAVLVVPSLELVAPRFTSARSRLRGQLSIDLPRAELVDLGRLRELLPLPGGVGLEGGRGTAKLRAHVDLGSLSLRGRGQLVLRRVRARVGSTKLFADVAARVSARTRVGAEGYTDLSGTTLRITRAGTGHAPTRQGAWWGNVLLRTATLRTRPRLFFVTKAHLTAKDANPAIAVVEQNLGVPAWAANIFRMPRLQADAEVRLSQSSFEVRSLVARGSGKAVQAEYAKRGGRQDGAVLLNLGWMDLGYDLADGATGLVILGPDRWFERKKAGLRNAAAAAKRQTEAAGQLARYNAMTREVRRKEARALAAQCGDEARSCDGASLAILLRSAADAGERTRLRGIAYAPVVVAAARGGTDGVAFDSLVVGSVAEAVRLGGESTLDHIPSVPFAVAANDPDRARGKVIAITGRVSLIRRRGGHAIGVLGTAANPVYFVTPFATEVAVGTSTRFRGVFVQHYASASGSPHAALVLVGTFNGLQAARRGGRRD